MHPMYLCSRCNGQLYFDGKDWVCKDCKNKFRPNYYYSPYQPYPGSYYHHNRLNNEISGLIPNRYDALFYTGIGIFILLFFALLSTHGNINVYLFMVFSIVIPILAIYLDFQNSPRSSTGTLGNICAIIWIILQILATIVFGLFLYSGSF